MLRLRISEKKLKKVLIRVIIVLVIILFIMLLWDRMTLIDRHNACVEQMKHCICGGWINAGR